MPGLSDIPVLGRLFSNKRTDNQRTDVILTLTPHIIRNAEITEEDLQPIWVGTEANISFRGGSPRVESDVEGPFDAGERDPRGDPGRDPAPHPAPAAGPAAGRERRGHVCRGEPVEGQPGEVPPPPGIDLVPVAPPTDIFNEPPSLEPDAEIRGGAAGRGAADRWRGGRRHGLARASAGHSRGGDHRRDRRDRCDQRRRRPGRGGAGRRGPEVRLWLTPAAVAVAPGDLFEVRIQAAAAAAVAHLPLALSFDPAVLAVEKVEAGEFLGPAGRPRCSPTPRAPASCWSAPAASARTPGVTGTGTVARITFRAVAPGASRARLPREPGDGRLVAPAAAGGRRRSRRGGRSARGPGGGAAAPQGAQPKREAR